MTPSAIWFIILILGTFSPAFADADAFRKFELELQLLDRINDARMNPLAAAEAIGLDPDQVLSDLPQLEDLLREGFYPLYFNADLREAASAHTQDMLHQDYYGRVSPDGATPLDRIRSAGYLPEEAGERLGVLGFFNFIDPSEAVDRIFENMFREELDPNRTEPRLILSPRMEEVGIGFDGGALTLKGVRYNVYLVTCDFAKSPVSSLELAFLSLINQARANPLTMAAHFGLDPDALLANMPEQEALVQNGMPPLVFNRELYLSARSHAEDQLENDYYSALSRDGSSVYDRVSNAGYDPQIVLEAMRLLSTVQYVSPEEAAGIQFERMFMRELTPGASRRIILNPDLREIGIHIVTVTPEFWKTREITNAYSDYYTQLVVMNAGISADSVLSEAVNLSDQVYNLSGLVYTDWNGDGIFGIEDSVPHVPIAVSGDSEDMFFLSDRAGRFSVDLEQGEYSVSAWVQPDPEAVQVEIDKSNVKVDFEVFTERDGADT